MRYTRWPPFWISTKPGLAPVCDEDVPPTVLRGYQENGAGVLQPGTFFDVTLPIWRACKGLSHAARFTTLLETADDPEIRLCCKFGRHASEWLEVGWSQAVSDFKGRHFEGEIVLWAVRWSLPIRHQLP